MQNAQHGMALQVEGDVYSSNYQDAAPPSISSMPPAIPPPPPRSMSEFYVVMCSEARMKTHLIKWTSCVHGEVAHLSLQMVHWLICSIFSCSFVLLWWHRHLAPLYPTFHYTNHIFSQRISHWQLHFTIPTLSVFPKSVFQKLLRKKYIFLLQTVSSIPSLVFFSSTTIISIPTSNFLLRLTLVFSKLLWASPQPAVIIQPSAQPDRRPSDGREARGGGLAWPTSQHLRCNFKWLLVFLRI